MTGLSQFRSILKGDPGDTYAELALQKACQPCVHPANTDNVHQQLCQPVNLLVRREALLVPTTAIRFG